MGIARTCASLIRLQSPMMRPSIRRSIIVLLLPIFWDFGRGGSQSDQDPFFTRRNGMVAMQIAARGVRDPRVLPALRDVPRHLFVPAAEQAQAYEDRALPIGYGQTISQPYIVALMTEVVRPGPGDRALEVGTG